MQQQQRQQHKQGEPAVQLMWQPVAAGNPAHLMTLACCLTQQAAERVQHPQSKA
jgi:hypothetical protein